jgi:hypothetical protein
MVKSSKFSVKKPSHIYKMLKYGEEWATPKGKNNSSKACSGFWG